MSDAPPTRAARERAIAERVDALLARAAGHGYPRRPVTVRHDLRGLAAGTATPATGLLRFNAVLAAENWAHFFVHAVAHEVAHLVAGWRWGRDGLGHGPCWRETMQLFGVPPERCHRYDTANSRVRRERRWPYRCDCPQAHQLTTTRHYRVLDGRASYLCRRCGATLVAVGDCWPDWVDLSSVR